MFFAEGEGFEPSSQVNDHRLSRTTVSAVLTHPSICFFYPPRLTQNDVSGSNGMKPFIVFQCFCEGLEEAAGFEPAAPLRGTCFRDRHHKPLDHASVNASDA